MQLTWISLITFAGAILAPWICKKSGRSISGWLLATIPAAITVHLFFLLPGIINGQTIRESTSWIPALAIDFSFYLDGLSLLFALLVSGIGTLIVIYGSAYLEESRHLGRFYSFTLLFMGAMLGLVLADNLVTLFIYWELTGISSYLLIGYKHHSEASRRAALQALLVTGAGGLALLAGFIILGNLKGSYELSELIMMQGMTQENSLYVPVMLLILAGAFTKSAQFPFHFWLPNAMEAPTPVSAYLHSATMVKAGIYLLSRLNPVLGNTAFWHISLSLAGAVTMLYGAILAVRQHDLKKMLAYSTISALGTLVLLLGIDTQEAFKAAFIFMIVHALYKGALFMITGIIDHYTATRDIRKLTALAKRLPLINPAVILAALSMAGLPPLLGFISKELVYEAKMQAPNAAWLITTFGVAANMLMVALAGRILMKPFFSKPAKGETIRAEKLRPAYWFGPLLLSMIGLIVGMFPDLLGTVLLEPALAAIDARFIDIKLALWHGFNPVLLLSLLTFAGGILIYLLLRQYYDQFLKVRLPDMLKADMLYDTFLTAFTRSAEIITNSIQNGMLRRYLFIIISFPLLIIVVYIILRQTPIEPIPPDDITIGGVLFSIMIVSAALVAAFTRSRLMAIVALGVIGFSVALIFLSYGAPDLAITQFSVETLAVIVFVLVLRKLPRFRPYTRLSARLRDGILAGTVGLGMSIFAYAILSAPVDKTVSSFYAMNSYLQARGKNVVNVILVDFRSLDTLGEISVLLVAAVGIIAMMRHTFTKENES